MIERPEGAWWHLSSLPEPTYPKYTTCARRGRATARLAVLDALVDTASDVMFSIDTANRIAIWNRSAVRVLGYDASEIVGTEYDQLFPEGLRNEVGAAFDAVAAGDRIEHFETEIERRDGMPVQISLSVCAVSRRRDSCRVRRGDPGHHGAAPRPDHARRGRGAAP